MSIIVAIREGQGWPAGVSKPEVTWESHQKCWEACGSLAGAGVVRGLGGRGAEQ